MFLCLLTFDIILELVGSLWTPRSKHDVMCVCVCVSQRRGSKGLKVPCSDERAATMWAQMCVRSTSCSLLYHWPFHIPQPAPGSEPSLAATLHALFELGLGIGRFVCIWLGYVERTCSCCIFTLTGMSAGLFLYWLITPWSLLHSTQIRKQRLTQTAVINWSDILCEITIFCSYAGFDLGSTHSTKQGR